MAESAPLEPMPADRRRSHWPVLALVCGWLCTIVAVCAASVTVATGGYQGVLRFALVAALFAMLWFTFAFARGSRAIRLFAVIGVLPLLFVFVDCLRRYQF